MATVSRTQIAKTILAKLDSGASHAKMAREVAAYLVAERRSSDLMPILREVERLRRKEHGVIEVTATSAFPISEQIKKDIKALLHEQHVVFNEVRDPSQVGGVRVETPELLLDLTVRNRLKALKRAGKA